MHKKSLFICLTTLLGGAATLLAAGCSPSAKPSDPAVGPEPSRASTAAPASASASAKAPEATAASSPGAAPVASPGKAAPGPQVERGPAVMPTVGERGKGTLDRGPAGDPPAGVPAALYATLFEKGRSWKLTGTDKHSHYDDGPKQSKGRFKATCEVKSVERMSWGMLSQIDCEGFPNTFGMDPVSGAWIAVPEGLLHSSDAGRGGTLDLSTFRLVVAANPAPLDRTIKDPKEPQFGLRVVVTAKGWGWCADESSWGGDEGWIGVCIDPKAGFVAGKWGWAGGSTHEAQFVASPGK